MNLYDRIRKAMTDQPDTLKRLQERTKSHASAYQRYPLYGLIRFPLILFYQTNGVGCHTFLTPHKSHFL